MTDKKYQAALDFTLKLLSRYPRSIAEIKKKLSQKSYQAEIIDQIVAELSESGHLDDEAYTERWLEMQLGNRPCGRLVCYKKLRQKGIDNDLIQKILDQNYSTEKELELAKKLTKNKRETLASKKNAKNVSEKIAFHLKNKGFPGDIIYQVIEDDI